jgi:hypothetical protein
VSDRTWPAWAALLLGVVVAAVAVVAQEPPEAEPADAPRTVFSAGRAMKHVEAIADSPHPTGSPRAEKVREYILGKLRELGLEPEVQSPRDASIPLRNILVRLKGRGARDRKAVLLCAHYDSVSSGPGAGDNASGVASVLETLRALKVSQTLERDVIALFDDGEEAGLLGAELFVDEHPWAKEVGVVLNLDARGNHGPSFMFETTPRNGWLIRRFAEASPHPLATSFSMDVYRLMPSDTNLTVFKRAGLDGLNFAFGRGLAYYHSPEDTPANLDPRTLQHHGENALALARHLGNLDLENVRGEDVIYFTALNRTTFFYPATLAAPLALVPAGAWLLALVLGVARRRVKFGHLLVGLVVWPLALVASVFAVGTFWIVLRDMLATLGIPYEKIDLPILVACALVAALVTLALERRAADGRSVESISLGALAWLVLLASATARYLPGMSYLFTWPAAFALLGLCLGMMMPKGTVLQAEANLLGCAPALILFPPLAREAFEAMGLRLAAPTMILVVIFLGAIMPLLGPLIQHRRAGTSG